MACKEYQELVEPIILNPESEIPQGWEAHTKNCVECTKVINLISEERLFNDLLKKTFINIQKEIQSKKILPDSLADIEFLKEKIKLPTKQITAQKRRMRIEFDFQRYKYILSTAAVLIFAIIFFNSNNDEVKSVNTKGSEKLKTSNVQIKKNQNIRRPVVNQQKIDAPKEESSQITKIQAEESPGVQVQSDETNIDGSKAQELDNQRREREAAVREAQKAGREARRRDPTNSFLKPIEEKEVYDSKEEELTVNSRKLWREVFRNPQDEEKKQELRKILEELGDERMLERLNEMDGHRNRINQRDQEREQEANQN
ncbi:MAG: hypothetical protein OEZ13_01635 [Spirochaetia bacterium]|nr:hypothetical protein [Spirochaetia bacterium]